MKIVWASHPIPAADIISRLQAADSSWHPKTARTLLARLVEKGALKYEVEGRQYRYAPLVDQEACVSAAATSFLSRVFDGALQPMLLHFVQGKKLSAGDLAELRAMIDRQDKRPKP